MADDAPETSALPLACEETHENEANNFVWLALHQVFMRIGWIFKTESIVIPYFMDAIGGGPVLRGSLMVFNRLGFSIPPALYASTLKRMPRKCRSVLVTTAGMAIPFAVLSGLWASGLWRGPGGEPAAWMPYFFLAAYGVFFTVTGLNQLAVHSVNGKLIRPERRGRLFAAGVFVGAPIAIACAWLLMPRWLELPDGGFTWLFAAPAVLFLLASLTQLGVREKPDDFDEVSESPARRLWDATVLGLRSDDCRRIAITSLLFSTTFTLFPHYQALARQTAEASNASGFDLRSLMIWTVTQHTSVALLSLLTGPLADRLGNRAAVRFCMFGTALAPLAAVALALAPPEVTTRWFWLVFIPLGFTPVTIKMIINYTLEVAPREDHPRYVSAIGMCLAWPVILGSPLVGAMVGWFGCVPVFAAGVVVLLAAGWQTLGLVEPRNAT